MQPNAPPARWSAAPVTAAIVVAVLALFGAGLVFVTTKLVERDRDQLVDAFAGQRRYQLTEAAGVVEESLDDVVADLRFASKLVVDASGAREREWALRALLGSTTAYRAAVVTGPEGRQLVMDPSAPGQAISPALEAAIRDTTERATHAEPERIEVSAPLSADAGDDTWTRVFAVSLAGEGAFALIVDARPFLEPLRLLLNEDTRMLVLGPHGRPTPASSPSLNAAVERADPSIGGLITSMRAGESGTVRLDRAVAATLDLPDADVVAVWAPIRMEGGRHWSMATFSSTAALREHDRAAVWRFTFASSALGLVGILFVAYVGVSGRRAAVLEEKLAHREQVAHLEEKAQKILDNIPSPVIALDAAGCVSATNAASRSLAPRVTPGSDLAAALPGADQATLRRVRALVHDALAGGRSVGIVSQRLRLFEREGTYSVRAVPLAPPSEAARVLLVVDDLSELSALQQHLIRAEKLSTVGILAAGIAHEIGTPLGIIRGRAEYIAGKLGPAHPQSDGIRVIVDQIDRVVRTIRALLDFSRQRPVALAPVPVTPVVRAATDLIRYESERRGIEVDASEVDDVMVAADPDQLQQVLVNLLMNALDASEPGDRILVRAVRSGPVVVLEVRDQGQGIPQGDLNRILDPFFTTKKRGQGTGLGLTIVDQIAREHGATLEIHSSTGAGTTVALRWPVVREDEVVNA